MKFLINKTCFAASETADLHAVANFLVFKKTGLLFE